MIPCESLLDSCRVSAFVIDGVRMKKPIIAAIPLFLFQTFVFGSDCFYPGICAHDVVNCPVDEKELCGICPMNLRMSNETTCSGCLFEGVMTQGYIEAAMCVRDTFGWPNVCASTDASCNLNNIIVRTGRIISHPDFGTACRMRCSVDSPLKIDGVSYCQGSFQRSTWTIEAAYCGGSTATLENLVKHEVQHYLGHYFDQPWRSDVGHTIACNIQPSAVSVGAGCAMP